tara:strand:+ start:52 stop:354 length:303 start_codon:yes stop_codon:yes gene_type:complete
MKLEKSKVPILIHRTKLESFIRSSNGKIFSCLFLKKDGTFRAMNCRLGVTKGIKGTGKPIHNSTNSYMTVYDMMKKNYRVINLDTLELLEMGGKLYHVKD